MAIPLCRDFGENPPRLFIKERVQQRNATDEFRSHLRGTRHLKIYCPGRAQIARLRDNFGFGAKSGKSANRNSDERRDAKECSNAHVRV